MVIQPSKEYCESHHLLYPQSITITSSDDGMWSLNPFVAGWGLTADGRKVWVSMSDDEDRDFKVLSWE